MMHKNPKAMREALAAALAGGSQRPNPATGTMQTDGPMVQAPAVWQSAPNHPPTMLAYITPDEAALLAKKDMHNSGVDQKPHFGPNGIPSFNGYDGSGGYDTGGDGGSGQGGVSDGTTGASVGVDGSYTGPGGTYSDVNASLGGGAGGAMLGEDRVTAPNLGVAIGPASLAGAQNFGMIGNRIGERIDHAAANPVATGINTLASLALGPVGMVNSLSGLLGGPTIGSAMTAAGRGLSGYNGEQAAAAAPSSSKPEGDGGPLGGSSISGGSGASGAGGPISQQPGANNALASALLGNSPFNQGRMTYGALVDSFDPNGRRYVTPWAYRG